MEAKKTKKADLRRKSGLFFQIGLLLAMCLVVFAFEFKNYDEGGQVETAQVQDDFEDLLEIPPTEQPPPPPPKVQQPEIIEVPDEEEIEEEIEVDLDVEITEEEVIEEIIVEEAPEEEVAEEIFQIVEDPAQPPGGYPAFYKFVADKLKYPAQARRMGIEGKVFVQFVVDTDGTLTDVQAVKGIGAGCDEEAVRVIKSAPKWSPPKQRGKPVKQRIILPITFKLG
ncbi:energy transducer TonB [Fulvivirga sediminis]|uniref:Energy transducer TonB n=1 Tax=Fulvivirga sediminis TaxID=2803949 RepID=A0A937F6K6_9BACT|nr:energy transducer TonB [Fulvivirga sediminis]MBL3655018.1 energy transducer TonB [Fulvivirga sediminis]